MTRTNLKTPIIMRNFFVTFFLTKKYSKKIMKPFIIRQNISLFVKQLAVVLPFIAGQKLNLMQGIYRILDIHPCLSSQWSKLIVSTSSTPRKSSEKAFPARLALLS